MEPGDIFEIRGQPYITLEITDHNDSQDPCSGCSFYTDSGVSCTDDLLDDISCWTKDGRAVIFKEYT